MRVALALITLAQASCRDHHRWWQILLGCHVSVQVALLACKAYGMVKKLKVHSRPWLTINPPLVKIGTISRSCDHNWNWKSLRVQIQVESPQGAKK
jgi:hypothetical protein